MDDNEQIAPTDRLVLVGMTGGGKTYWEGKTVVVPAVPRLVVVDCKGDDKEGILSWPLQEWSAKTRRALADGSPVRVRIPPLLEIAEYDRLYYELYHKYTDYLLVLDEVGETTTQQGTRDFRRLYKLGRTKGIGIHAGVQEPAFVPSVVFSQAIWIVMFTLPTPIHRERMAKTGIGAAALTPLKKWWYYTYRIGWTAPRLHPPWPAPPVQVAP